MGVGVDQLPFVSIIVPVYNEEKNIRKCIGALLNQSYPRSRYEILIVDDNSSDNTQSVVREYPVKLLVEDRRSSYAARNKGIQNARGEILAFTDADAIASSNWIKEGVKTIKKYDANYVGCKIIPYKNGDGLTWWDLFDLALAFPVEKFIRYDGFVPTAGLFVKKSLIEHVGMFDPRLISSGDTEFGKRVRDAGFTQLYAERAVVYHPTRSTLKDQVRKELRIGKGKLQLSIYHPERFKKPIWNLLNPIHFLPPNPLRATSKRNVKFKQIGIITFMMGYVIKLLQHLGMFIAYSKMKDDDLARYERARV